MRIGLGKLDSSEALWLPKGHFRVDRAKSDGAQQGLRPTWRTQMPMRRFQFDNTGQRAVQGLRCSLLALRLPIVVSRVDFQNELRITRRNCQSEDHCVTDKVLRM